MVEMLIRGYCGRNGAANSELKAIKKSRGASDAVE